MLGETRYFGKTGWDADGIFSMKLANKATSFIAIPVVGYHWTIRKDSISGRPVSNEVNLERIRNWIDYFEYLMSTKKQRLASTEIFFVSYLIMIMKSCYSNVKSRKQNKKAVKAGIACVKRVIARYQVSLSIQHRFFLAAPFVWGCQKSIAVFFHRIRKKINRIKNNPSQVNR